MDCLILAAGKGLRLMPLTEDKPKAMIKIKDKPIIDWSLNVLKDNNIDKIFIISGYMEGKLKSYVKYNFQDMDITFVHQKERTGTADAIYLTKNLIDDDFIVISGDIIYKQEDIDDLIKINNSLLYTRQYDRLYEYGTLDIGDIDVDGSTEIKFINEKTSRPTSIYINCGAYHFNKDVFKYIEKTYYDNRFGEKIITNTINLMINDGIKFYGVWTDELNEVSYPEDIEKVESKIK
jgi:NDP-sugar pyrophosphorylase family protein